MKTPAEIGRLYGINPRRITDLRYARRIDLEWFVCMGRWFLVKDEFVPELVAAVRSYEEAIQERHRLAAERAVQRRKALRRKSRRARKPVAAAGVR